MRGLLPRDQGFVVVAESFSGPIAIRLAADPPPGLQGVILVATFAASPTRIPAGLLRPLLPSLVLAPAPGWPITRLLLGFSPPESLCTALLQAIHSVEPAVLHHRIVEVLEVDVTPQLRRAAVPLRYLRAAQDRVVPARCGKLVARLVPKLEPITIPGPHLLLQREAQAAATVIIDQGPRTA